MNQKILVVDDMPDILAEVRHILSKNFDVHTAKSGREALDLCQHAGPFAIVLTDQGMPGMNGTELLAHMRKGWPDTVRIMMTGYADLELAIEALHKGAIFRFLQKPFRSRDLLDAIEGAIERFGRLQEEHLLTEQLQFSRESLLSLTDTLEHRLASQIGRMRGLQRFALELARTGSLQEVAERTAIATSKLLGSRAVVVVLEEASSGLVVQGARGSELPSEIHQESIRAQEVDVGTIQIADRDEAGNRLNESDREILLSVACIAGISAHHQLALRACDMANDATILALERLAENRDDETGKHLERVSLYCGLIAETLREDERYATVIDKQFIRDLTTSAPLHDIGKVGIPDSILLKPGPLTEQEWEVMRKHTTIGARTLIHIIEHTKEQSFLRMGHEIAWAHHERWDGSGYPRALVGAEIPLAARIVALADCYDALTTWRPYKGPWTHEEARDYVIEQRGKHFDPDVVRAFEQRIDEFEEIRTLLADTQEEIEAKRAA